MTLDLEGSSFRGMFKLRGVTSNPSGLNQRFLSKLPGSDRPQYERHSQRMSVVRASQLAAAYSSQPHSPRSAPSSDAAADSPYSVSSLLDWLASSFFLHPPSSAALMLFLLLSGSKQPTNLVGRHRPYESLKQIIGPPIPFHTVCIDFVVGLPVSHDGYNAIAFITCKFTKRMGAIPGKNTWKSKHWALAVLAHLENADWCLLTVWISDRDPKFIKGLWRSMFNALTVALFLAAAYHAQADGQSKRTNQKAEIRLRHWTSLHPTEDWPVSPPSLRAAMNSAGPGPAAGRGRMFEIAAMQMKDYYDRRHQPKHFEVGDKILLRKAVSADMSTA
ncbi:hypothetical protein N7501_002979 [Penicillium viridicatum]|nr:hypothetical protein N7501_002979 [Penicillium viridicatum]